jgi:hypothetical protein
MSLLDGALNFFWLGYYKDPALARLKPGMLHIEFQVYGIRSLKKLPDWEALTGIAFEKAPVPSSVPVLFVVQTIGGDRLVAVSQVYPLFGVPLAPVRIR